MRWRITKARRHGNPPRPHSLSKTPLPSQPESSPTITARNEECESKGKSAPDGAQLKLNARDTLIKTHPSTHLLLAVPAQQSVQKPSPPLFSAIPALFFCHSGESRNPSSSCDLGIAKEREARALFTGFPPAREWRSVPCHWEVFSRGFGFSEFLHSLESRNPAQIERGTRTLQTLADRPRLLPQRSAKRAHYSLDSRPCSSQGQALRGNGGWGRRNSGIVCCRFNQSIPR